MQNEVTKFECGSSGGKSPKLLYVLTGPDVTQAFIIMFTPNFYGHGTCGNGKPGL